MSEQAHSLAHSASHSAEETAAAFQSQFEALEIPPNIDPQLLAIWLEREQAEIDRKKRKHEQPPKLSGRKLNRLFAAYIGITVMCISIMLGLVQHREASSILQTTCIVFLIYTVAGFFVGMIAERCVADSVETLLRDIVRRSRTDTDADE
ncbi:MAG: hypothetical protein LBH00_00050 [Planctomycetaceae bacterium]|jgi:hypothetical protein|nr:hypothetical protein [Planctomycetaceae bacterium]